MYIKKKYYSCRQISWNQSISDTNHSNKNKKEFNYYLWTEILFISPCKKSIALNVEE